MLPLCFAAPKFDHLLEELAAKWEQKYLFVAIFSPDALPLKPLTTTGFNCLSRSSERENLSPGTGDSSRVITFSSQLRLSAFKNKKQCFYSWLKIETFDGSEENDEDPRNIRQLRLVNLINSFYSNVG